MGKADFNEYTTPRIKYFDMSSESFFCTSFEAELDDFYYYEDEE